MLPLEEFNRRQDIIRKLFQSCKYKKGDIVRPVSDASFAKDGYIKIQGVCSTYHECRGSESETEYKWPSNDNPMIVNMFAMKAKAPFNCTVNYLRPLTDEEKKEYLEWATKEEKNV